MKNDLIAKVSELGLSEKESKVYIAILKLGMATADEIAKASNLNRSTTYVQIENLQSVSLITKFKDGKKTKFIAESPLNLSRYLELHQEELRRKEMRAELLLPDLMNMYSASGNQTEVRYFEGIEGLKSIRTELLNSKSKEYYAAASIDNMQKLFSEKELIEFSKKRAKKNITSYLLYTTEGEPLQAVGKQKLLQVEADKFPFSSDVYIYDDKVSFANTSNRIGGTIIQNAGTAATMRSLFKIIWES